MKNKKSIMTFIFLGTLIAGGLSLSTKSLANDNNYMGNGYHHMNYQQIDTSKLISIDEAKKIALKNSPKATITSIELDSRRGLPVYEIEFLEGNTRKEYKIDATNGNIVKYDEKDYSRYMHNKMYKNDECYMYNNYSNINNNVALSMEDAIKIALDNSKNGVIDDIEFKIKKGIPVYEIEVKEAIGEKEFVIDANSGKILKQKRDF